MFRTLPIKDRELFLRYAVPCGGVLVRRGELRESLLDNFRHSVRDKQEIKEPIEDVFKVASRMCTILAKQMGKTEIDAGVIRKYFLSEHEKAIEWRRQVKPDINVKDCIVRPGRVLRIDPDGVMVRTKLGEKLFRNDFAGDVKVNDWVSVHYDYISEKIDPAKANKMLRGEL